MSTLTETQARDYLHTLLGELCRRGGHDLFIAHDFPPSMKLHGRLQPLDPRRLTGEDTAQLARALMNGRQRDEFARALECNLRMAVPGVGRFRVNAFVRKQPVGLVLHTSPEQVPTLAQLQLPDALQGLAMEKRGLVLVVGASGSGKSTTLAAMVDHRNRTAYDHILTIEDPVEYRHRSRNSLVTHREIGADTHSWSEALRNTLRQAPDVVLIGEVRDSQTMDHAMALAETGHLCLSSLHANGAAQALERIVNLTPEEGRQKLLADLAANLRAVVSQRLLRREDDSGGVAAVEVLVNVPAIAERIAKGEFHELKTIMSRSRELGMRTFDWALFDLYNQGLVSYEETLRNADSVNELRLNIKLKSARGEPAIGSGMTLTIDETPAEQLEAERRAELQRQARRRREFEDEQLARMQREKALRALAADGLRSPA